MSSPNPPPFDFVESFCEFTKDFESPLSFWKWSAYGAIAATLRHNCYLKWGTSNLYPNLYILLLADSAAYRKDAGPELVGELLKECAHTKVIMGRASWQGIVDELATDIGNKKTGVPIKGGSGIIIATEFTAAFVEDPSLIKMMTEGYGYVEEYEYTLRGGKTKVKNRCISMLGGSNETLLRDLYNVQASYGGLLRRTCLIKPDKRRPPNSFFEDDKTNFLEIDKKKALLNQLKTIQNLKGELTLTRDAIIAYRDWYKDLYKSYEHIDDRSGFIQGVHTLIAKLSIIIACSKNILIINEDIINRAIKEILDLKENYTTFIMGSGKNPHANMGATILATLWSNSNNGKGPSLKRRDILLKHWNEISSEDLEKLLMTLESAGLIQMIPQGSEPSYQLTQTAKDAFLKNIQSKSAKIN